MLWLGTRGHYDHWGDIVLHQTSMQMSDDEKHREKSISKCINERDSWKTNREQTIRQNKALGAVGAVVVVGWWWWWVVVWLTCNGLHSSCTYLPAALLLLHSSISPSHRKYLSLYLHTHHHQVSVQHKASLGLVSHFIILVLLLDYIVI